jgi:competence protein ComEC
MSKNRRIFQILALLLALNLFAWLAVFDLIGPESLEVNFLNVGQGDAIFIETSGNHQILIDGGPDTTILERLGGLMPFWDRTIDLLVLTHPDSDHITGLTYVLENYKVENVLWTGVVGSSGVLAKWLELIEEEESQVFMAKAGREILSAGAKFKVLFPLESLVGQSAKDLNNSSVVMRLDFGETSFLFTGDIQELIEKQLVGEGINLEADILKVAHHGSKTSTGREFIEAVSPQAAVISVGLDNKYGHPHQTVLDTLREYDITIFRTDSSNNIKITTNGINYGISTF